VSAGLGPADRVVQGQPRTTTMYASGKSDEGGVTTNRRRPAGRGKGEGRPETAENPDWPTGDAGLRVHDERAGTDTTSSSC
jgi:hypothetical protein